MTQNFKRKDADARRRKQYAELLRVTGKILSQAEAMIEEVQDFPLRRRTALQGLTETLATMTGRVRQGGPTSQSTHLRWPEAIPREDGEFV